MNLEFYNKIKEKYSDNCLICSTQRKIHLSLSEIDLQDEFSYIRRVLRTNRSKIKFCTCTTYEKTRNFIREWNNKTSKKRDYLTDDIVFTAVK